MAEVPTRRLKLEDRKFLSPPIVGEPLYQCAIAVSVYGFVPQAKLDLEINGVIVLAGISAGFPQPQGALLTLAAPLNQGDIVRARQTSGSMVSGWSVPVTVADHTKDFPDGPPRPEINPAPVYECGSRTGVSNLLTGCEVWITADAVEVGKVIGAAPHQGVNVTPDYGLGETVRAWASMCKDPSPPSEAYVTVAPPNPLPAPAIDPVYEGTEQIRITNLVNGARFELSRNGASLGVWRTWGYAHLVGLSPPLTTGELLRVTQRMCPGNPDSPPGDGTVLPCSALPAPQVAPIQGGATTVTIIQMASGATIKVYVNLVKAGEGGGPVVVLNAPVKHGDVVHVIQVIGTCVSQYAQEIKVQCVAPPVSADPAGLNLFPVGHLEYDGGTTSIAGQSLHVRGSVYYPAEDDGEKQPFHKRRAERGPVPIVFMAHGNHSPADPSYLGYDYFQQRLARMGIIAVSVDCNELNGNIYNTANIFDRADLINASIEHFKSLAATDAIFKNTIDFNKVGLMGHSRGGEAVIIMPSRPSVPAGVTVVSVLSLAPTDWGATSGPPAGYEYMTILPAADGDVVDNDGAKYYDRANPLSFKSQVYVHNANHNYFNRQWLNNDNGGSLPTLPRSDHEHVLLAYGCAYFRATLAGHGTLGFLIGSHLPPAVPTSLAHLSFKWNKVLTVDDHQDANTIATNSMNEPTAQTGLTADEHGFGQGLPAQFNNSFYGDSVGMVAVPRKKNGTHRSQLAKGTSVLAKEIWIRAADVFSGSVASSATGFELGLELSGGTIKWVDSDDVGGVPLPFDRGSITKTMPKTLRFPVSCFGLTKRNANIRAIVIRLNRTNSRALAFDDLQIV
jgi:hypothetical protein